LVFILRALWCALTAQPPPFKWVVGQDDDSIQWAPVGEASKITSKITSNLLNEIVFCCKGGDGHHQKNNFPFPQTKMNEILRAFIMCIHIKP
jgi:hypothetical protein